MNKVLQDSKRGRKRVVVVVEREKDSREREIV